MKLCDGIAGLEVEELDCLAAAGGLAMVMELEVVASLGELGFRGETNLRGGCADVGGWA